MTKMTISDDNIDNRPEWERSERQRRYVGRQNDKRSQWQTVATKVGFILP